jgi:hypothetical protein
VNVGDLQVNPLTVIGILKARLVEEQTKSAVLEAALQEARAREAALMEQAAKSSAEASPEPTG